MSTPPKESEKKVEALLWALNRAMPKRKVKAMVPIKPTPPTTPKNSPETSPKNKDKPK